MQTVLPASRKQSGCKVYRSCWQLSARAGTGDQADAQTTTAETKLTGRSLSIEPLILTTSLPPAQAPDGARRRAARTTGGLFNDCLTRGAAEVSVESSQTRTRCGDKSWC